MKIVINGLPDNKNKQLSERYALFIFNFLCSLKQTMSWIQKSIWLSFLMQGSVDTIMQSFRWTMEVFGFSIFAEEELEGVS